MDKQKIGFSKRKIDILIIVAICSVVLVHAAFAFFIISCINYVNLDATIFLCIFGIMICSLIIVDILFYFSFKFKHKVLKIVSLSIAGLLLIAGIVGSILIARVNSSVNKMVDTQDDVQYEMIRAVVAVYDNDDIKELSDLNSKTIGTLNTSGISAASVGKKNIEDNGVSANFTEYNTTADLFTALVEGDVDAAVFPNVFKTQLSTDDETYDEFFEKTEIIYEYEEKVQTNDDELSKKDLSSEPFTVLLIGYAPEAGGGGLTDTIILASVNPKTMSVSMTSIARDSYVPITCYGNNRSKINDAGAASNACLMDTVEQLMGVDIDFYMKVNFQGIVDIVDAIGGVYIDSPVEFVGQSPSSKRGEYTVWVPQGPYIANGEQALAFARERHAMPAGDFDRQINQQELIRRIVEKVISMKDINKALKVLEAAGENLSTNMTVSQITSVLNYILSVPNYTGQSKFKIIDIKSSRLTGYTYWFYSYSMRLPLWSYYLYDGSIKENVELSKETLGIFDNIKQWDRMNIFVNEPYIRDVIYHDYFNEPHVPENMPAIYPSLIGYSYDDAVAWANENGVSINWITIDSSDPSYNEAQAGTVVAQDPRKGALIEEYPSCTLTLMGAALSAEDKVPNFVGKSINEAIAWCNSNGISYNATEIENTEAEKSNLVKTQSVSAGSNKHKVDSIDFTYYKKVVVTVDVSGMIGKTVNEVKTFCANNGITNYSIEGCEGATVTSVNPTSGTSDATFVFTTSPHNYSETSRTEPTCTNEGVIVKKCSTCNKEITEAIPATGHSWGEWSAPDADGNQTRSCNNGCGATETKHTDPQEPDPQEPTGPETPIETMHLAFDINNTPLITNRRLDAINIKVKNNFLCFNKRNG